MGFEIQCCGFECAMQRQKIDHKSSIQKLTPLKRDRLKPLPMSEISSELLYEDLVEKHMDLLEKYEKEQQENENMKQTLNSLKT